MKVVGFVLLSCLGCGYAQNLNEGDVCNLPLGEIGRCSRPNNCEKQKILIQSQQNPKVCGYQGKDALVCCKVKLGDYGALSRKKCGEYYKYKRYFIIIGGAEPSLAQEFPHMAILGYGDINSIEWSCGGSLISPNYILTAAHCLRTKFGSPTVVRLGDLDLSVNTDNAQPQDFSVKRVIVHPEYKKPSRYHDIGLIELNRNANLSTLYVGIACLDTLRKHNERKMIVTGWGKTAFTGGSSSFLLKSDFDIIPNNVCRPFYAKLDRTLLQSGIADDLQICAGGSKDKDTCQGDSGGPLQILNEERSASMKVYDIVGVTSFGKACGLSNAPGIYTRVYNYIPWIESIVWPSS